MTTPSETRAGKLPDLPEPTGVGTRRNDSMTQLADPFIYAYTADQMRAYALEALAASEPDMRDAYEGAREDLLDWKGRAQRAEARLRSMGWTGIDASEPVEAVAVVEVNGLSLSGIVRTKYGRSIDLRDGTKLYTHPAPEQPCPCGESTCVEPWEPGCGLGTKAEYAAVSPEQPGKGEGESCK